MKENIIREFSQPITIRKLNEFLGVVNCYRCFIPEAVDILRPLHDLPKGLTRKPKAPLQWKENAVSAFHKIKEDLAQVMFLACPECCYTTPPSHGRVE